MRVIHSNTYKDQGKSYIYTSGDNVIAIKKYRQKNYKEEGLTEYKLTDSSFFLLQFDDSNDLYLYGSHYKKRFPLAVTSLSLLEVRPVSNEDLVEYLEYFFPGSDEVSLYGSLIKHVILNKNSEETLRFNFLPIHKNLASEIDSNNIDRNLLISDEVFDIIEETSTLGDSVKSIIKHFNRDTTESYFRQAKARYGYPYSISDMSYAYQMLYKEYPIKTKANESDTLLAELINPFSFGVEIETSEGIVDMVSLLKNNFVFLRDGSLDGGLEYTSLPLKGADGIAKLRNFCASLAECSINEFCSLHIHLGGVNLSKEEVVSLYKTVFQCQQELFDFVPSYKRSSKYFARKAEYKDHCKPLKSLGLYQEENVNQMYRSIYNFVTMNGQFGNQDDVDEDDEEYFGEDEGQVNKWNKLSRYHHLNLLNWFEKGSTIEFRLHEPTTNYQKIVSWLLIISAITKYAKKYSNQIINNELKISLMKIILDIYPTNVSSYLNKYIKHRTILYNNSYITGSDEDYYHLRNDNEVFMPAEFASILTNKEMV